MAAGLAVALSFLAPIAPAAQAATAKVGASCSPKGKVVGQLVCTKSGSKLVWLKKQTIVATVPQASAGPLDQPISIKLSSGLKPRLVVNTTGICGVTQTLISKLAPGTCKFTLSQAGNKVFAPLAAKTFSVEIKPIAIDFHLASQVAISAGFINVSASTADDYPIAFRILSPAVCQISGTKVSLLAVGECHIEASITRSDLGAWAAPVEQHIDVVQGRTTLDQPDSFAGFQIKPVYVVPADVTDRNLDTNGKLAKILSDGDDFLQSKLGLTLQIDSTAAGYDITYMKSKYTKAQIQNMQDATITNLAQEFGAMDKPGINRKDYVFFVEVPYFEGGEACGIANIDGLNAIVALGNEGTPTGGNCANKSLNFDNYASLTWVHEVFHNFGVNHTMDNNCDMMRASGSCSTAWTIDASRTRYVGSAAQGANVLKLRVWKGYTFDQTLRASCLLTYQETDRADGLRYVYCPTGTQPIGALSYCWSAIRSAELQEWVNDTWVTVGTGSGSTAPWGPNVAWACDDSSFTAPGTSVTRVSPGVAKYRWMVNGKEAEQLVVIWVQ